MPQSEMNFPSSDGPDFQHELRLKERNIWPVAGLDEAGRGPLAGPVVAAAVILDEDNIPEGLNDSKKLTEKRRKELYREILGSSHVSFVCHSSKHIDQSNILRASLEAMRKAVLALPIKPEYALVDGRDIPPNISVPSEALIKGDARSLSIAAASIVAKVVRDHIMIRCADVYPEYGFEKHAGYGTKFHREAIHNCGPTPIHRMSFRPLRKD